MTPGPQHIAGHTVHARRGGPDNAFRYGIDYVLIDPLSDDGPALFSRNRFNLASVHDIDHGGPLKKGRGVSWARDILDAEGLGDTRIYLLTQPRFLGYVFNPVSFWLAYRDKNLLAVIAEVSTPFGDRHSYLCRAPNGRPIDKSTRITTEKNLHVSPYQKVEGLYHFNIDIDDEKVAIRILHENGNQGVIATLHGTRKPLTNLSLVKAYLRRPFGAFRTIALIYWQALVLKLKGAIYRTRPTPPEAELTHSRRH